MSKIPEGATHKNAFGFFCKYHAGVWYSYADGDWIRFIDAELETYIPIQAEPEWAPMSGYIVHCGTHNRDVEILKEPERVPYITAPCRALDNNELFWGGGFIPVKTPEQIASDERMAAAYAMCGVASSLSNTDAAKLYDAGLRFVEVTK